LAVNKRKILDAAQKYVQKGQLDKALKEYQTLVDLDPRDANLRLKLGDLHLRQGNKEPAIACYLKVADSFMQSGFDAKAVALYKQIAKIDDKRQDIYMPLAELYQRLGLTSEALAALQVAADHHHREGRKREALELLRKMASLDPTNTTSRIKIADLLRQADMPADALAEYEGVAQELERQGASDELLRVYERILELEPGRASVSAAMARVLVGRGQLDRAEPFARRAIEHGPTEPDGHQLLAEILTGLRRNDAATEAYKTLAQVYRDRGDETRAREIAQRFLTAPDLSLNGADFGDLSIGAGSEQAAELGAVAAAAAAPEPAPGPADTPVPDPMLELSGAGDSGSFSADPEQLLAEASVYLRYGKTDRAIATLESLLTGEPDHRPALEKLGEAHAERGDHAKAVEIWLRAAHVAEVEENAHAVATLRERIGALDPQAAASLGGGDEPAAEEVDLPARRGAHPAAPDALDDVDLDIDLDAGDLDGGDGADDLDVDVDSGPDARGEPPGAAEKTMFQLDADSGAGSDPEADSDGGNGRPGEAEATVFQLDGMTMPGARGDAGATVFQVDADADSDAEREPDAAQSGGSSTTPQQIAEDLAEADFYLEQGLLDEAEAIYRRIVEAAPNHPQALLRLGEIAEQRGADPGSSGGVAARAESPTGPPTQPFADGEPGDDSAGDDLIDWELDDDTDTDQAAAPEVHGEAAAPEPADDDVEIEVDLRGAPAEDAVAPAGDHSDDSTRPELATPAARARAERAAARPEEQTAPQPRPRAERTPAPPPEPELVLARAPESAQAAEPEELEPPEAEAAAAAAVCDEAPAAEPSPAQAEAPAAEDEPGETFDLAAELSDVFDSEEPSTGDAVDDGFAAIFREFKKGVRAQLSESDYEAHYDLGIAYREMGLFDDAVGEFQISLGSPERKLSSLHMLGLCALDLGRAEEAVAQLEQALGLPAVPLEQQAALRFDLGRALEQQGDVAGARRAFEAVLGFDPDHQDVRERLAALDAGDAGGEPASELSSFESFDDLIAEAEAALDRPRAQATPEDDAADEPESEPELEAEPLEAEAELEPEPEPEPEPPVRGRSPAEPKPLARKKKRVSFL
jgi:tetratricopeptide (TPR) repeat protein